LKSNSYAYRFYLFTAYWHIPGNRNAYLEQKEALTRYGFTPLVGFRPVVPESKPASAVDNTPPPSVFSFDPKAWAGFEAIVDMQNNDMRLVVLEAPSEHVYFEFGNGGTYQSGYFDVVADYLKNHHVVLLDTSSFSQILSPDDWYDQAHLNIRGVAPLNQWLGQKLAEIYPEKP